MAASCRKARCGSNPRHLSGLPLVLEERKQRFDITTSNITSAPSRATLFVPIWGSSVLAYGDRHPQFDAAPPIRVAGG